MILAETSVWIDHFRKGNARLNELLIEAHVACHPFIIGELACENLKKKGEIILLLQALPSVTTISNAEALYFIEENRLMRLGIGIVDVHLLASAKISNMPLWTTDGQLKDVARRLDILYKMTE